MTEEIQVIKVAVGIIKDEDRYIIARRSDKGELCGQWEFPGGSVTTGTSNEEALKNHLADKFNIDVVVGDKVAVSAHDYEFGRVELSAYQVECISKKIKLAEHFAYRKIRMNMFKEFEMVPVSTPVIEQLRQKQD